jgi:hypothetical protein
VSADADDGLVRRALLDELKVHVRIADQGHAPDKAGLRRLSEAIPAIAAFPNRSFKSVRAILDWDHQLPSQFYLLRILASYDARDMERVDETIADRDEEIGEFNLYPEFDVPDYGDIEASEVYIAVMRPGTGEVEDFRFMSAWRKQVTSSIADAAVRAVTEHPDYRKAHSARRTEGLGGPIVIGWAPPSLAESERWAIEIWLLTEFDGQVGKARVFMVDPEDRKVTREYETDVQLA